MGAGGAKRAPLQLERACFLVPLHESVPRIAILFRTTARISDFTVRHSSATGRTLSVDFNFFFFFFFLRESLRRYKT